MHLETAYTRSPIHYATVDDMHLHVLKRVGGGPDDKTPRYFMGIGGTRAQAAAQALKDARARIGRDVEYRSV